MKNSLWKTRLENATDKIEDLISQLTVEEKVSLCHAGGKFCNHGVERLGIPPLVMSDGPHGVRQELNMHGWEPIATDSDRTTYLPVGICTASAWNPDLGIKFGEVLGSESRARSKDMILGPGFNIIRDPLCGRNFEYYSEDPYLISQLNPRVIQGIQSTDTAACAKHFALNNQELNRHGYSAEPDERTLREIYLPGFEASVKVGETLTLMGSYNKYNGQWCCHNKVLLVDILKGEWGFEGLVVSDWDGAHVSDESATNGLDIEMGTGAPSYDDYHLANAFLDGLKDGRYSEDLVNDKVRRILRVIFAIGMMDPDSRAIGKQHPREHCEVGRAIAEEGVILLKNDGQLPLQKTKLKKIAVIGDNATRLHAMGGGSSGVKPFYEITPFEALQSKLGEDVEIVHRKGYPEEALTLPQIPDHHLATVDVGSGIKGWRVEWNNFHQFEGETLAVEFREQVSLSYPADTIIVEGQRSMWWATRWNAELTAPESGAYTFALNADFSARCIIDGKEIIAFQGNKELLLHTASVSLEKGQKYKLEIQYCHSTGDAHLQFGWFMPGESVPNAGESREAAVAAAKDADAVLFFGGLNHFHDNEGMDRKSYQLPGGQNELIDAFCEVNDSVTVILVGGSAHAMPWVDKVNSILLGGYAGMDCGNVFADILFGHVNPSGKLTYTFAQKLEDYPAHALDDYHADVVKYKEGILVGYRWFDAKNIEPLFPFGYGLSYSSFEISDLNTEVSTAGITSQVTLTNTGDRPGKEVVQLYVEDVECSVLRPPKELKGFQKVALKPNESATITFKLLERDLSFWDIETQAWKAEPGLFKLHAGTSSRSLPLTALVNWK